MEKSNLGVDRDLFGVNIKILKLVGMWNPFTTPLKKALYTIYSILVVFIIAENVFLTYVDMIQNFNIVIIADSLPVLITISCNVLKMIYFLSRHKTLRGIINQLNLGLYPGMTILTEEETRAKNRSYYLTVTVIGVGLFSCFAVYVKVGFSLYNFDMSTVSPNSTEPFMAFLRIRQWYPTSWWFKNYVLVSLHGVLGVMVWGPPTDMGHDCLIAALLIHIACQFEVIQRRVADYASDEKIDDHERYELLRKCLIFHQRSLK